MENPTFGIVIFSALIEALITYINQFFVSGEFSWKMLASIALGVLVSIAYGLDLPAHFNLHSQIPYLGNILTGILLSRGSNYVFDVIKKLSIS